MVGMGVFRGARKLPKGGWKWFEPNPRISLGRQAERKVAPKLVQLWGPLGSLWIGRVLVGAQVEACVSRSEVGGCGLEKGLQSRPGTGTELKKAFGILGQFWSSVSQFGATFGVTPRPCLVRIL